MGLLKTLHPLVELLGAIILYSIMTSNLSLKEQAEELARGVVEISPGGTKALEALLKKAQEENRPLRVKLGIDPTSTDLHLGHMVCIQKLKQFQDMGHRPVLIIGGYTAQVGDPTGRNEMRPPLTPDDVAANAQTYLEQVGKILDLNKTELVNNADWFNKFSMADTLKLAAKATVNQMVAKEAFGKRIADGHPLYMHETFYPLLQGYDSVEVRSDIELGGTDQTFNLLVGRDLQKNYAVSQQLAMTMPLLVGLDGVKKMSKTTQNYIALTDSPSEMFGKTMSIPDELIIDYFTLAAAPVVSVSELSEIKKDLADGVNPRDIKALLAKKIISVYYTNAEAEAAEASFIKQFKQNEIPDELPEYKLNAETSLIQLMVDTELSDSKAEAKRSVAGGGVKLDGVKLSDPQQIISLNGSESVVLQLGKRKFVRLV